MTRTVHVATAAAGLALFASPLFLPVAAADTSPLRTKVQIEHAERAAIGATAPTKAQIEHAERSATSATAARTKARIERAERAASSATALTKAQIERAERAERAATGPIALTKAQIEQRERQQSLSGEGQGTAASTPLSSGTGDAAAWQLALSAALGATFVGGIVLVSRQVSQQRHPVAQ